MHILGIESLISSLKPDKNVLKPRTREALNNRFFVLE